MIFLYPEELAAALRGEEWLPERREIEGLAREFHLQLVDVARERT